MKIHLMGIGGVGMAGLAVLLKSRGHHVDGCDLDDSPRTAWLRGLGISVALGHDPAHLQSADLLVVTPAVRADEPELAHARAHDLRRRFRGEVLAEIVSESDSIAICGSHGKTTTATWTAKLLSALGDDPSWCIGGETGSFPVAHVGSGPLVVEADESDGTLALYHAKTLVVTNCEYDHPDHFKTVEEYRACYDTARAQAGEVIEGSSPCAVPAEGFAFLNDLPEHNRLNALAAIEVARRRGHSLASIAAALPAIVAELPDRRFERLADDLYTDYAHHPTEIRCAIAMARARCSGTLRVLFQPHRYSRTRALLDRFASAFDGADELVLCPTYAAFEKPLEGGDVANLYRACREHSGAPTLYLARTCEEAWLHAQRRRRDGDLTLILGAGNLLNSVRARLDSPNLQPIFIGSGSNTWQSDLDLGVEYVKTSGPAGALGATLGIPWMAGIPGTIGGWLKMNAGAFGHSISEVVRRVHAGGRWLTREECGFGYRHSDIQGEIDDAEFDLPERWNETAEDYLKRRPHFPAGTYGSFFRNPEGDFAGRLLEAVGAKELRVGGAYVWANHANVIVRGEGATASDVLALARLMHNRVYFRLGVDLIPEVAGITVSL